ncbi:hypothetical protein BJV82DRAFT_671971 [Fennellomyces sp. T-0311]|nr:hypothetical protein BJV82DRAFT_671971 [Fennellomyces sp. T-0311]
MVSTFQGSVDGLSGNYSESESSPDWSIDDNAQELLNEAIASNYRSHEPVASIEGQKRTGSKRKSLGKVADDSSSTSSSGGEKRTHKAGSAPKRAGRKPLEKTTPSDAPLDPKQKRKEQNRAAQRAFRERKERHVAELQDRIRELEDEAKSNSHLAEENAMLKKQLQKLQEENYTLKGTPFTFEYPPKTTTHDDEYQYRSNSTSSSCGSLSMGEKSSSNSEKSGSSISSSESPAMPLDHLSSLEEEDESLQDASPKDPQQLPTAQQQTVQQSPDDLLQQTFPSFHTSQEPLSIDDLLAPFATHDNFFNDHTPQSKDNFSFTRYRAPQQSADSLLLQADLPPLFGGDVDLFGLSGPAPSNDDIDPSVLQTAYGQKIPCDVAPLVKSLRQAKGQNPNATEIHRELKNYCPDFDLDDLCSELKEKAKCTEKTFSERDMEHIIDYFEHKQDRVN